jgi:hypothetical protein
VTKKAKLGIMMHVIPSNIYLPSHSPLTMKKLSEIQKTRNTKILLSDQDWKEEILLQERDVTLLKKMEISLRESFLV